MRARVLLALLIGLASCKTRPVEVKAPGRDEPAASDPAPATLSSGGARERAQEVFSFDLETHWDFPARVTARADGTCEAVFEDPVLLERIERADGAIEEIFDEERTRQVTLQVVLTIEDLDTFEMLVTEAGLPVEEPKGRGWGRELRGSLRVTRDGAPREFAVFESGTVEPLARWLRRLVTEAYCLRALRDGDPTWVIFYLPGEVPGPDGILHPSALREPLERLLETPGEHLAMAAEALARFATVEEWIGLLERRLRAEDDAEVDALAVALTAVHGLPSEAHHEALMAMLLATLEREYGDYTRLPEPRRWVAESIVQNFGDERYKPAIPVFARMIEEHAADPHWGVGMPPLAAMGADALDPLARLLASPDPRVREVAARTVRQVLNDTPSSWNREGEDPPGLEYALILDRLREEFAPKLREMVRGDPDAGATDAARSALLRIEKGWARR